MQENQLDLRTEVREKILAIIAQMNLQKESKLPSENELANMLDVSRSTVRTVLTFLENEGKVIRNHGSGTYVNLHAFNTKTTLYPQVYYGELIQRSGYTPSIQMLGVQRIPASRAESARAQLGLGEGDELLEVSKLYQASGRTCIYCIDYLHVSTIPAHLWDKLRKENISIFQFLDTYTGTQIVRDMVMLTAGDSREVTEITGYLNLREDEIKPLLVIDTTNYDAQNKPLIYSKSYVDTEMIKYYLMRNNFEDKDALLDE